MYLDGVALNCTTGRGINVPAYPITVIVPRKTSYSCGVEPPVCSRCGLGYLSALFPSSLSPSVATNKWMASSLHPYSRPSLNIPAVSRWWILFSNEKDHIHCIRAPVHVCAKTFTLGIRQRKQQRLVRRDLSLLQLEWSHTQLSIPVGIRQHSSTLLRAL